MSVLQLNNVFLEIRLNAWLKAKHHRNLFRCSFLHVYSTRIQLWPLRKPLSRKQLHSSKQFYSIEMCGIWLQIHFLVDLISYLSFKLTTVIHCSAVNSTNACVYLIEHRFLRLEALQMLCKSQCGRCLDWKLVDFKLM